MLQGIKRATEVRLKASGVLLRVAGVFLAVTSTTKAAVVDFRLTALSAPSGSDTTATVPASQPNFPLGSSIFLEVWVQTTNSNGLSSASLDLLYNSSLATGVNVTHSSVFSTLKHATINNSSGVIDDLSGSHLGPCTDAVGVTPNWARVAVVKFNADTDGVLTIQAVVSGSLVYGTAICNVGDVNPAQLSFGSVVVRLGDELGACCAVADNHCSQVTEAKCKTLGKGYAYRGDGTPCGSDGTCIPTVSEWGMAVLALSVLVAGSVLLRTRPVHAQRHAHP